MACYDEALRYTKDRVQFKRPIAGYQLVQEKLVNMVEEITKAQLISWRLGKLKESHKARPQQVSLAKRNNVRMARNIARDARDLLGANGVTDEYQAGRHMCNLESVFTYEGHRPHSYVDYWTGYYGLRCFRIRTTRRGRVLPDGFALLARRPSHEGWRGSRGSCHRNPHCSCSAARVVRGAERFRF